MANPHSHTGPGNLKNSKKVKKAIEGHSQLTSHMITQLMNDSYECIVCNQKSLELGFIVSFQVCCERVGRKANIWNCSKCFRIFHVSCITKWSRSSLREGGNYPTQNKKTFSFQFFFIPLIFSPGRWLCPGCRAEANSPPESSCFCSKARNPPFDPYMLPHSCGEECGKLREGNCPHPCVLGCHPGPCPDCSAMGPLKECYCGKTT